MSSQQILVTVTQDDINTGRRWSTDYCPIARAIRRVMDVEYVRVSPHNVTLKYHEWYTLPQNATAFIFRFDDHRPVEPFSFYLEGPSRR